MSKYYPAGHKLGMVVPRGGSSCAKCSFLSEDRQHCKNPYFQRWNKNENKAEDPSKIPTLADRYCCDLYALPAGSVRKVLESE